MIGCHRFLLIAPVLAATLSGCGMWDAWLQRGHDVPEQTALEDDLSSQGYRIAPGHSAPEVFNENYDPYNGEYAPYAPQSQKFAPPPAPPAQRNDVTSDLDRQRSQPEGTASNEQLIRTLKTPRIFSPDSVRSIYDRFRGSEEQQPPVDHIKREGPIALRQNSLSPTQPCGFDQVQTVGGPVRLGIPEKEQGPPLDSPLPADALGVPTVIQACPSSYRHPMFADPGGITDERR